MGNDELIRFGEDLIKVRLEKVGKGESFDVEHHGVCYRFLTESPLKSQLQERLQELWRLYPSLSSQEALRSMTTRKVVHQTTSELPQSLLRDVIGAEAALRGTLRTLRLEARANLAAGNSPREVARIYSDGVSKMVNSLFEEGVRRFGSPPCGYAVGILGSLARQEAGPYPDIDCMLVVEKRTPETVAFFSKVNAYVADRLFRLGETQETGLRFCTGGLTPPYERGDFRLAEYPIAAFLDSHQRRIQSLPDGEEKTRLQNELQELQKTYKLLSEVRAKLKEDPQNPGLMQEQGELLQILGPMRGRLDLIAERPVSTHEIPILDNRCIGGDAALHRKFITNLRMAHETQVKEDLQKTVSRLGEEAKTALFTQPIVSGELPEILHVKEQLYRFPQATIFLLSQREGVDELNTFERIAKLKEKSILPEQLADRLSDAMEHLVKLRRITQDKAGSEFEFVSTIDPSQLLTYQKKLEQLQTTSLTEEGAHTVKFHLEEVLPKVGAKSLTLSSEDLQLLKEKTLPAIHDYYEWLLARNSA